MASKHEADKPQRRPRRTITDQEKGAFTGLLEQLDNMRREQREEQKEKPADDSGATPQPPPSIEEENEMSNVSGIFEEVLRGIRRRRIRRAWIVQLDEERREDTQGESEVERSEQIGTGLARATERPEQIGTGLVGDTERPEQIGTGVSEVTETPRRNQSEVSDEGAIPMAVAIRTITRRESAKIEGALREAIDDGRGDIGVWEICKERIFSMLQYLDTVQESEQSHFSGSDLASVSPENKPPEIPDHPKGMESLDGEYKEANDENLQLPQGDESKPDFIPGPMRIPSWVPVESVVSVLYPRLLLVAFRLISTNFPKSPLISQFRSTIKAHGRTSSVVGASNELYNELIFFYWRGCNDLPAVISLLEEMELTGVEPNRRTHKLLHGIIKQRDSDLRQWHGRRHAGEETSKNPWWDMPPNRKVLYQILGHDGWIRKVRKRVKELEVAKEENSRRYPKSRGRRGPHDREDRV